MPFRWPKFLSFNKRSDSSGIKNPQKWLENFFAGGGLKTLSGTEISEDTSMAISAVFSCVTLISETVASLPLIVYKERKGGGKDRAKSHPLYDKLKCKPNPDMTAFSWRESQTGHLALMGNRYSFIERDRIGRVSNLYPLDPTKIKVERLENGRIQYERTRTNGPAEKITAENMLHVPGFSFNGIVGKSVVGFQREKLGVAAALDEFEGRFFGSGTNPGAYVEFPPEMQWKDEDHQKAYMKLLKTQWAGLQNIHGLVGLFNGEKVTRAAMPLDDAQFVELSKAKAIDICGWFKVPPHMIGILDNATFSNIEHQAIQFVTNCIRPWLVREEQACNLKLFSDRERQQGYFCENIIDALLRGDAQARGEFFRVMWNIGAMSQNEIRAKENMNPVDGGDAYYVPLNMIPADKADALADSNIDGADKGTPPAENKALEHRSAAERRSIRLRDRISRRYLPLFRNAAQDIINREGLAVKKQINQQRKRRASTDMSKWLDDFYRDHAAYIRDKIGPVTTSFSESIRDAAIDEIGAELDRETFDSFVSDYIARYVERHADSSRRQLQKLLDEQGLDELETRVDEWAETRSDKIAVDETTRSGNAIFQVVAFSAGLSTVWRIRGKDTCPYCTEFDGRKVSSGQFFIDSGSTVEPKGQQPMKIRGMKAHPPLHQGCDCYLSVE